MPRTALRLLALPLAGLLLAGCAMSAERELPPPREGNVRDVPAFNEFLAEYEPTPEELRAVYPDLTLVLPGDIATKEMRMNNSRFFAELDDEGHVVDGRFQ